MQDLDKALSHLADIHAQVSRTEYYRGLNSLPTAITGISGMLAALLQPLWINTQQPEAFVWYWVGIATFNIVFMGMCLGRNYWYNHTRFERRKTHAVLMQFMPSLCAGLLLTMVALSWQQAILFYCLPGVWALLFALGIFACRPFFPPRIFWLGVYYLLAAAWLLSLAPSAASLHPWGMGSVFGLGQLLVAGTIYWEIERHEY